VSLEGKTLFVGMMVGLAHIASGIAVLFEPSSLNVTPLASLRHLIEWTSATSAAAGIALLIAGIAAVVASRLWIPIPNEWRMIFFAPQQLLLLGMIWTIGHSVVTGIYPDGYSPQGRGWFIESDQIWAFILAVNHSAWMAALLYGDGVKRGTAT
jgi:hypothetical protein